MIPWWIVLIAYGVGFFCGMVLMACCAVAGRADERIERGDEK